MRTGTSDDMAWLSALRQCRLSSWSRTLENRMISSTSIYDTFESFNLPKSVRIVEVGPRDGLQNEPNNIPTEQKIELINLLSRTGLKTIETTAFVSHRRVPQMADASQVLRGIQKECGISYPVLTPNMKGFEAALAAGAEEVAVFTSASEIFNQKNLSRSIYESLAGFDEIIKMAKSESVCVRGYVSVAVGCPYSGRVNPDVASSIAKELYSKGCYEISMGDTIGVGTPADIMAMIESCKKHIPVSALAVHLHDTYGQGLANVYAALMCGVSVVDSSIAGLGGCPFAPGATGNIATEDVVYLLDGLGIDSGVQMDSLLHATRYVTEVFGLENSSRCALALLQQMHSS